MCHTGRVLGGYAVAYIPGTSDILEDGVMPARFFRKAQAAVFAPPALEWWWAPTPLRRVMFTEIQCS
jgi:hypothetical protein